jgi:DNA repair exonuclease SbcCD ATPase subunit
MGEVESIESEIQRHRGRIQELTSTISDLQTVVQFNEEMLEGDSTEIAAALETDDETESGELTEQLITDTVVCWTCGSKVESDQIESTVDRIRDLHQSKLEQRQELESEIDELQDEKATYEQQQQTRERTERRLASIEDEIDERTETLDELEADREDVAAQISDLEDEIEDVEQDDDAYSEILDLHKRVNQLEIEHERLQSERDEITERIDAMGSELGERDDLQERRKEITEELEELQTRIERIETDAIEEFNQNMDTVLSLLEYENIDRIWIERVQRDVREGRRKVTKNAFELHIVRSTDSGAVYEDSIDHLSESEREVTGLVFALAGYLVHDVHEVVPFMLLDSIEAIDADRIAGLVDHFEQYADYLVVALLTEDAAALDDAYPRVTGI